MNRDRGWFWGENSSFFNGFLFFESGNIPRTLIYKSMRLYFPGRVLHKEFYQGDKFDHFIYYFQNMYCSNPKLAFNGPLFSFS